jgi:uncharacterized membrane protein
MPEHTKSRQLLAEPIGRLFLVGCVELVLFLVLIGILWRNGIGVWDNLLAMCFIQVFFGRIASAAQAAQSNIGIPLALALMVYIDMMVVFLSFPVLVFSYERLFHRPFFQKHMKRVFDSAEKSVKKLSGYRILGVFFFVWSPLLMTGVIVGSVLGYLLGLRLRTNMVTVALGTTAASLCFLLGWDTLFDWLLDFHSGIPIVATTLLVIVILMMRIARMRRTKEGGSK